MSPILLIFVALALLFMGLLLWAVPAPRTESKSPAELLQSLSTTREYCRLPQILVALGEKDTEFLIERNHRNLARRVREERRQIALQFLDLVELDYRNLIEVSRLLSSMAPEVMAAQEWQRLRLNMRFSWNCTLLRFRLRTGLNPWNGFARLSDMAGQLSYRVEAAVQNIGERAGLSSEFSSLLEERGREPR
jgi:hypothetical protein